MMASLPLLRCVVLMGRAQLARASARALAEEAVASGLAASQKLGPTESRGRTKR
jgi:hypothetical protein